MYPIKNDVPLLIDIMKRAKSIQNSKITYAIVRTIKNLSEEKERIEEATAPGEDFLEYEKEFEALKIKYAVKKKDGEPQLLQKEENGKTVLSYRIEDKEGFIAEMEDLDLKYKQARVNFKEKEKSNKEFLNQPLDPVLFWNIDWDDVKDLSLKGGEFLAVALLLKQKITFDMIPADTSGDVMEVLMHFFDI